MRSTAGQTKGITRRGFLRRLAGITHSAESGPQVAPAPHLPVITPAGRFFARPPRQGHVPDLRWESWTLAVDGLVARPGALTYRDLRALPAQGTMITLVSEAYRPGLELVGNAVWRGVRLAEVLATCKRLPGARWAIIEAADGDAVAVPVSAAEEVLLAYEMNGAMLHAAYGHPVRLIVPGHVEEVSLRWVTRLWLSDVPPVGIRQVSAATRVRPFAALLWPQHLECVQRGSAVTLQGIACAGERPVEAVLVRVDGSEAMPARLHPLPSAHAWVQWSAVWRPEMVGPVQIEVRPVVDGTRTAAESHVLVLTVEA